MAIAELKSGTEYKYHHIVTMQKYIIRKIEGIVEEYDGRFVVGYKVMRPRWDTTRFCYVDYYILETN